MASHLLVKPRDAGDRPAMRDLERWLKTYCSGLSPFSEMWNMIGFVVSANRVERSKGWRGVVAAGI